MPARRPSAKPTSKTPKFCKVKGTGVKGSGSVMRAHSATSRLAPTTIETWRATSKAGC